MRYSLSNNCDGGISHGACLWGGSPLSFGGTQFFSLCCFNCLSDACVPVALCLEFSFCNCCSEVLCESLFLVCGGYSWFPLDSDIGGTFMANCLSLAIWVTFVSLLLTSPDPAAKLGPPLIPEALRLSRWSALPIVHVARARRGCTARVAGTLKFPRWWLLRDSWKPKFLAFELKKVLFELFIGEPRAFEDVTEKIKREFLIKL